MALDPSAIREKLRLLADRDWPEEFGPDQHDDDYFGWSHRYRLEDPISEAEVEQFERTYRVSLPLDYRTFLTQLGNGGAGPAYGIYRLGEEEVDPLPSQILGSLAKEFALSGPWNDTDLLAEPETYYGYELMAGAMPISTRGCALDYWMVVSGTRRGQIWLDKRTDSEGVVPVLDRGGQVATFGTWYEEWLEETFARRAVG